MSDRIPAAEPTDAMVDAYLQAQRRAVEDADRFGRPNIGGLHTDTVREACRAGLKAAFAAAQPAAEPFGYVNAESVERHRCINDKRTVYFSTPVYLAAQPARAGGDAPAETEQRLRQALRFYANREHFFTPDPGTWDTVSGEPPNYWCDEAGTATVEDGTIAAMALRGVALTWEDGEEPPVCPGEPEAAALAAAPQPAAAEPAGGVADELAKHLRAAHAFIENTDAFGRTASRGILDCGGCIWNVDESKAALSRHETGARATSVEQPAASAVPAAELVEAARFAADVLSTLYARYSVKIGPYASQAQLANTRLGTALRAAPAAVEREVQVFPAGYAWTLCVPVGCIPAGVYQANKPLDVSGVGFEAALSKALKDGSATCLVSSDQPAASETPRELDLIAKIKAQCDHAAFNDHRLSPHFGQLQGDIAVREDYIDAAIKGWRREHGIPLPGSRFINCTAVNNGDAIVGVRMRGIGSSKEGGAV